MHVRVVGFGEFFGSGEEFLYGRELLSKDIRGIKGRNLKKTYTCEILGDFG